MHKKVIDNETLSEIIQNCIEKRLNEAFLDEELMNSFGYGPQPFPGLALKNAGTRTKNSAITNTPPKKQVRK